MRTKQLIGATTENKSRAKNERMFAMKTRKRFAQKKSPWTILHASLILLCVLLVSPTLSAQTCQTPGDLLVTGNVGIGTNSPSDKLTVSNSGIGQLALVNTISTGGSWRAYVGDAGCFGTNNFGIGPTVTPPNGLCGGPLGNVLTLTPGGNVGIGTTSPSYQLQLSTDSAAKPGTNTWTVASDARIKTGVRDFTDGLAVVQGIRPVWYQYNGKGGFAADGKGHIGVIAQEIEPVAPYTVSTYKAKLDASDTEDTQLLNFNSHALPFILINAVKEQQKQIEQLKAENAGLTTALNELASRVASLERAGVAHTK